jgi:hypothetical protein
MLNGSESPHRTCRDLVLFSPRCDRCRKHQAFPGMGYLSRNRRCRCRARHRHCNRAAAVTRNGKPGICGSVHNSKSEPRQRRGAGRGSEPRHGVGESRQRRTECGVGRYLVRSVGFSPLPFRVRLISPLQLFLVRFVFWRSGARWHALRHPSRPSRKHLSDPAATAAT